MVMEMEEAQTKVVQAYQIASKRNFDHARLILEETLYDHPQHIEGWLLLADLAEEAKEARQCYQMVLEIDPGNWIAQQRIKLLFSQEEEEENSQVLETVTDALFQDEEEPKVTLEPIQPELVRDAVLISDLKKKKPTLKQSYQAHKKLIWGIGVGIMLLFGISIVSWIASVGFIIWKTGFLAWFGF